MAKEKEGKEKKATTRVTVECPGCNKKLVVSAYRKRTNEPIKAEYKMWGEVAPDDQKNLPGMEDEPSGDAEEEK